MSANLGRILVKRKTGDEHFHAEGASLGFTLRAFWSWSTSDLVSNATRGRLAEFIVAKALGIPTDTVRDEWGAYDLSTPEGVKIEIKSAAFLQRWHQTRFSTIQFLTRKTRAWDPDTNCQSKEQRRQADFYIFALLAHKDKQTLDPLDVRQWQFYILPTEVLNKRTRSQHSITLKTLEKVSCGPIDYFHLGEALRRLKPSSDGQPPA